MPGLLGKKIGMTQVFDEKGRQVAVTVLEVGPCFVTEIRTPERDGYAAVQLGYSPVSERRLKKPVLGQLKKAKQKPLKYLREFRTEDVEGLSLGSELGADNFEAGQFVDIEGTSIGKGFQSVIKRHHFSGGEAAHGCKFGRENGSIGMSAYPSRVIKGMKMPGRMGGEKVTVQNLQIFKVDAENRLLIVKGAVPGPEDQCLVIRDSLKKTEPRKWKVLETAKPEAEKEPQEEKAEKGEEKAEAEKPKAERTKDDAPQAEKPAPAKVKADEGAKEAPTDKAPKEAPPEEPKPKSPEDKSK